MTKVKIAIFHFPKFSMPEFSVIYHWLPDSSLNYFKSLYLLQCNKILIPMYFLTQCPRERNPVWLGKKLEYGWQNYGRGVSRSWIWDCRGWENSSCNREKKLHIDGIKGDLLRKNIKRTLVVRVIMVKLLPEKVT